MFKINDVVTVVKSDDNRGKQGVIVYMYEWPNICVTAYKVKFEDGTTKEYFYTEISH